MKKILYALSGLFILAGIAFAFSGNDMLQGSFSGASGGTFGSSGPAAATMESATAPMKNTTQGGWMSLIPEGGIDLKIAAKLDDDRYTGVIDMDRTDAEREYALLETAITNFENNQTAITSELAKASPDSAIIEAKIAANEAYLSQMNIQHAFLTDYKDYQHETYDSILLVYEAFVEFASAKLTEYEEAKEEKTELWLEMLTLNGEKLLYQEDIDFIRTNTSETETHDFQSNLTIYEISDRGQVEGGQYYYLDIYYDYYYQGLIDEADHNANCIGNFTKARDYDRSDLDDATDDLAQCLNAGFTRTFGDSLAVDEIFTSIDTNSYTANQYGSYSKRMDQMDKFMGLTQDALDGLYSGYIDPLNNYVSDANSEITDIEDQITDIEEELSSLNETIEDLAEQAKLIEGVGQATLDELLENRDEFYSNYAWMSGKLNSTKVSDYQDTHDTTVITYGELLLEIASTEITETSEEIEEEIATVDEEATEQILDEVEEEQQEEEEKKEAPEVFDYTQHLDELLHEYEEQGISLDALSSLWDELIQDYRNEHPTPDEETIQGFTEEVKAIAETHLKELEQAKEEEQKEEEPQEEDKTVEEDTHETTTPAEEKNAETQTDDAPVIVEETQTEVKEDIVIEEVIETTQTTEVQEVVDAVALDDTETEEPLPEMEVEEEIIEETIEEETEVAIEEVVEETSNETVTTDAAENTAAESTTTTNSTELAQLEEALEAAEAAAQAAQSAAQAAQSAATSSNSSSGGNTYITYESASTTSTTTANPSTQNTTTSGSTSNTSMATNTASTTSTSSSSTNSSSSSLPFTDINSDSWEGKAIGKLYEIGIMKGDGNGHVRPWDNANRAEVITMLMRSLYDEAVLGLMNFEVTFEDVGKDVWYYNHVHAALKLGIIDKAAYFNPGTPMTRAEVVVAIVNAANIKCEECTASFTDMDPNDWYAKAVAAALEAKIISGFEDGSFRPNDYINRAQIASVITKALDLNLVGR